MSKLAVHKKSEPALPGRFLKIVHVVPSAPYGMSTLTHFFTCLKI